MDTRHARRKGHRRRQFVSSVRVEISAGTSRVDAWDRHRCETGAQASRPMVRARTVVCPNRKSGNRRRQAGAAEGAPRDSGGMFQETDREPKASGESFTGPPRCTAAAHRAFVGFVRHGHEIGTCQSGRPKRASLRPEQLKPQAVASRRAKRSLTVVNIPSNWYIG